MCLRSIVIIIAIIGVICSVGILAISNILFLFGSSFQFLAVVVFSVISLLLHILLFFGAGVEQPEWILPYVVIVMVILISIAVTNVTGVVAKTFNLHDYELLTVPRIIVYILGVFLWLIVFRYYVQLARRPRSTSETPRENRRHLPDITAIMYRNYRLYLQRLRRPESQSPTDELQNVQNQNIENTML